MQDFDFISPESQSRSESDPRSRARSAVRRKPRFDDEEESAPGTGRGPALRRGRLTELERARLDEAREQDRDPDLPEGG